MGQENLLEELMAENFPNLGKETNVYFQESKGLTNKMNPKRPIPTLYN